jgi:hypothetical protein
VSFFHLILYCFQNTSFLKNKYLPILANGSNPSFYYLLTVTEDTLSISETSFLVINCQNM